MRLIVLASVLALAALVAQPGSSAPKVSGKIAISATINDVRITGGARRGKGDHRIETYRLWNHAISNVPIGNGTMICTNLGNHRSFCNGVFVMPLGKMTVAGTRRAIYRAFLAVTGGTRAYAGVGGTLSMLQGDEPRSLSLVFRVG